MDDTEVEVLNEIFEDMLFRQECLLTDAIDLLEDISNGGVGPMTMHTIDRCEDEWMIEAKALVEAIKDYMNND